VKVIYVAGKYRADSESGVFENIIHSRAVAQRLWHEGWAVICPHMNSAFMGLNLIFLDGDLEILKRCDAIYMLKDWEQSVGATKELEIAKKCGLKVYFEE